MGTCGRATRCNRIMRLPRIWLSTLLIPHVPSSIGHRPSFRGHSTYQRGLPRRRGTDAPHRLWIGVLWGREVSGSTRGRGPPLQRVRFPCSINSVRSPLGHAETPGHAGQVWVLRGSVTRISAAVLPRPSRSSTSQVSPYVLRRGGEAAPRGRACILVPSNYGRSIAIMIRDSAFRRHLIANCYYC